MLLVALKNVGHERAFRGQKATSNFQCFSMPKFTLCFDLSCIDLEFFFAISEESQLSAYTKVRYRQEGNLFNYAVPAKLYVNLLITVQIKDSKWSYLHNVSYVEQVHPLRLIKIAKKHFHVDRVVVKTIYR